MEYDTPLSYINKTAINTFKPYDWRKFVLMKALVVTISTILLVKPPLLDS